MDNLPTTYVEALLTERQGYVARGQKDRVAQVDAELARHRIEVGPETAGGGSAGEVAGDVETAAPARPKGRGRARGGAQS